MPVWLTYMREREAISQFTVTPRPHRMLAEYAPPPDSQDDSELALAEADEQHDLLAMSSEPAQRAPQKKRLSVLLCSVVFTVLALAGYAAWSRSEAGMAGTSAASPTASPVTVPTGSLPQRMDVTPNPPTTPAALKVANAANAAAHAAADAAAAKEARDLQVLVDACRPSASSSDASESRGVTSAKRFSILISGLFILEMHEDGWLSAHSPRQRLTQCPDPLCMSMHASAQCTH